MHSGVPACSYHHERPWFATSALFLKSVHQSKIFYQSIAEVPGYSYTPWCVGNIPSFFFYWDTGRVHGEVPLWFPYWLLLERGHEAGEVLGLSWDGCSVLTKEEFAVALHALSVNAQTTFLVVKIPDLPFLEECVWHEIPVSWVTMSTLRADTFKFTYKLSSPLSSKLFPSFMRRGKCCSYKVTEKPDYLWCF